MMKIEKIKFKKERIAYNRRKVICLNNMNIFESLTEASNKTSATSSSIIMNCANKSNYAGINPENNEKLVWMYYDEYIKISDKNIIKNKIINANTHKNHRSIHIICLNDNIVFNSIKDASHWANIKNIRKISEYLKGLIELQSFHPETNELLQWAYFNPEIYKNYTLYMPQ